MNHPYNAGRSGAGRGLRLTPARVGLAALVASTALAAMIHAAGCEPTGDSFRCGTPLPNDTDAIRQCDTDHQICVCQKHSCARPWEYPPDGAPPDAGRECDSGFKYVDSVFAAAEVRGRCVSADDITWVLQPGTGNVACSNMRDGSTPTTTTSGAGGHGGASTTTTTSSVGGGGAMTTTTSTTGGAGGGKTP